MDLFPPPIMPPTRVAGVPRRIRAFAGGEMVFDTNSARYGWETEHYPQYYIPLSDVRDGALASEHRHEEGPFGRWEIHSLTVGPTARLAAARVLTDTSVDGLAATVRFDWDTLDSWYEEDEEVFVHPRNPYARVDPIRSTRHVRVELQSVLLGQSSSPVIVFETGLPPRYYLNKTEIDTSRLVPSQTVTRCPYKGTTSRYWGVQVGSEIHPDLAWCYDFPTRQLTPIAGLVAFYNEKVDITLDGRPLERPVTHLH